METNAQVVPFGFVTRFLIKLTGADVETLRSCPERDLDNVKAIAFLMLGVLLYQTALFAIVGHLMLMSTRGLDPGIILGAALIATLILQIDSYTVMRSGWHLHGIENLKRGGIDISGGLGMRIKNGIFLALRIAFSIVLAQLTAIFVSMLLFQGDIAREIDRSYQHANAALFAAEAKRVDAEIEAANLLARKSDERIGSLGTELAALRRELVEPAVDRTRLQPALDLVARLQTAKSNADSELARAQIFASDELAGVKGAPGNSGKAGTGPVRDAAEERVRVAASRVADMAKELAEASADLASVQANIADNAAAKREQARQRLAEVMAELAVEQTRNASLQSDRRAHVDRRESDIRTGVESDPTRANADDGFLARLAALKRVASDGGTAAVILLIDLASFGLELAAVLAKVTSFVPMTYATIIAREAYMDAYRAAQEIARDIETEALGPARWAGEPRDDPAPPEPDGLEDPNPPADPSAANVVPLADDEKAWSTPAILELPRKRGRPPKARPEFA